MKGRAGLSRRFIDRSLFVALLLFVAQTTHADSEQINAQKIARFISSSTKTVMGNTVTEPKTIETKTIEQWLDNPEIKEIATYPDMKRAVIIDATIDYLGKNEKKIFPAIQSNDQATVYVESRLIALGYLISLVADTPYDIVIKDYLDGEIADLKKMRNGAFEYGAIYSKGREVRDDKRGMLLHKNMKFVKEKIKLRTHKANMAAVFANKTSISALTGACASKPETCSRL